MSIEWVINKLESFTDRGFEENQKRCKAARAEYEELKKAAQQSVQADVLVTCANCGVYHSIYIPCFSGSAQAAHR